MTKTSGQSSLRARREAPLNLRLSPAILKSSLFSNNLNSSSSRYSSSWQQGTISIRIRVCLSTTISSNNIRTDRNRMTIPVGKGFRLGHALASAAPPIQTQAHITLAKRIRSSLNHTTQRIVKLLSHTKRQVKTQGSQTNRSGKKDGVLISK